MELLGSNQTFEEKQGLFSLLGTLRKEKKHATECVASENLRKGNEKKTASCKIAPHERHFAILLQNSLISEMCFLLPN